MKNKCHFCNNYSLLSVELKNDDNVTICVKCLREKIKNGEFAVRGKERIQFLEKLSSNMEVPNTSSHSLHHSDINIKSPSIQEKEIEPNEIYALNFGVDLTEKAKRNQLEPLIGREQEIENTLRVMERRFKNNPILVGEPGVGKTAIIEGIAKRIASGEVSNKLKNKKIISLSMGSLIAGTKFRGEYEERIKQIIDEAKERKNIILFIDEFHTIIGSNSDGSLDAAQMLKPALSRGEIQVIGTTTLDEYRLHIEKDKALERRFQKVYIKEPTMDETINIIEGLKKNYEQYHGVIIPTEVVKESVALSKKYITDRAFPDKAIDLIDEACAHKILQLSHNDNTILNKEKRLHTLARKKEKVLETANFQDVKNIFEEEKHLKHSLEKDQQLKQMKSVITTDDIAYILQSWTGIPAKKMTKKEKDKLKTFQQDMKKRIKGQDKAIETLAKSIKRNSVGLKDENRPVGVFMMLGPTGVGKTEMTKALTELLFGDEKKMIRFDMSEFMEKHSVSKLIGAPPGYAGYEDEGKLTIALRQNPYSVVVFDEIEKAHPDVSNLLLHLFEEGRISNAKGREIDARNSIFIMTSNVGSDLYASKKTALGFQTDNTSNEEELETKIKERLKQHYKPEFLNRIDEFLIFNRLSKENMLDIAHNMIENLQQQLKQQDIELNISSAAISTLAEKGYDPEMGARPLRREIDKLKNLIAEQIIEKEDANKIFVGARNNKIYVK